MKKTTERTTERTTENRPFGKIEVRDKINEVLNHRKFGVYTKGVLLINGKGISTNNLKEYLPKKHREIFSLYLYLSVLSELKKLKDYLLDNQIDLGGELSVKGDILEYIQSLHPYRGVYKGVVNHEGIQKRVEDIERYDTIKEYYLLNVLTYHLDTIKDKTEEEYFIISNKAGNKDVSIYTNIKMGLKYLEYNNDNISKYLESEGKPNLKSVRKSYINSNGDIKNYVEAYNVMYNTQLEDLTLNEVVKELVEYDCLLDRRDIEEIKVLVNNKHFEELTEPTPKGGVGSGTTHKESRLDNLESLTTLDDLYDKYDKDDMLQMKYPGMENETKKEDSIEEVKTEVRKESKENISTSEYKTTLEDVYGIQSYVEDNIKYINQPNTEKEVEAKVVSSEDKTTSLEEVKGMPKSLTQAHQSESVGEGCISPKINFDAVDKVYELFSLVGGVSPVRAVYKELKGKVDVEVIKSFINYEEISYYNYLTIERILKDKFGKGKEEK